MSKLCADHEVFAPITVRSQYNDSGYLKYVDVRATINFKPLNAQFFPFQVDLLDVYFDMPSSSLIHVDQDIVENILCIHPLGTGFGTNVVGIDWRHDKLVMVPRMTRDFNEPWLDEDNIKGLNQFHYGANSYLLRYGTGSKYKRMIALRVIVQHSYSNGWLKVFSLFFLSWAAGMYFFLLLMLF